MTEISPSLQCVDWAAIATTLFTRIIISPFYFAQKLRTKKKTKKKRFQFEGSSDLN